MAIGSIQSGVAPLPSQAYGSDNASTAKQQQAQAVQDVIHLAGQGAASNTAQATATTSKAPSATEVTEAVSQLNKFMQSMNNTALQFSVDKDTNISVVKLVDTQSKEVIRQIPSEDVLAVAKAINKFQGLLIKETA
ncbi:MAG: flagellar protein FlaG [Burkholderiales bacterium]|nr:flagellar protein FlaG [Burkholderiales bacterium]